MHIGWRTTPQNRVYAGFAVYSFGLGNIFPRLPDIQHAMGVRGGSARPRADRNAGRNAGGADLRHAAHRADRVPPVAPGGHPADGGGRSRVAVHAPDPLAFFLLLLPVGLMIGSIEIILNVEADRTEALVGRRIMNRAHSFWSFGFFAAGLAGGTLAQAGLSPQLHLALMVPVSMLAVALLLGGYQPAPRRPGEGKEAVPRFARPTGAILILVAVTLSAMLMEGASMDWSAIYMREVFASGPLRRRARGGDLRLLPGGDAVLRRRLRRPALAEHGRARAPLRDDGGGGAGLLLALARCLAPRLRAPRGRDERHLPAGDLGRGAAHRPAGGDQRRGARADLLRRLPARPAAPRLRGAALGHPLVVRDRPAARRGQPGAGRLARAASIGPRASSRKEGSRDPHR